ncbi:hypothetical protein [Planktothrix agardhii]|jgi:hypothetical protein|uniref:hypothetical protein n=1 Tax=Planktothrix agardhii TaxID=1160 RepID=UPI0020B3853D|nr:hypothetical protein [Planktothrix agardhii]CAD5937262.1 hypothetical protein PCC7811_01692 [Planktothrix agardhii]
MNSESPIAKQRYYDEQLLTLEDFQREQNFHIANRELQNQLLLKSGILMGLTIQVGPTHGQVQIMPGVAIDNSGRLINLTDSAKFNNANVLRQLGQFLLNLSDQQYYNKHWLLTLEYNEEEDPTNLSQWKVIPKFKLTLSTTEVSHDQVALATLNVTTTQGESSINIEIDSSIRVKAVIATEHIPDLKAEQIPSLSPEKITGILKAEQIPNLPASKIEGDFSIEQIPDLSAAKITSGQFNADQIPSLSPEKITGILKAEQIPNLPASKIEGDFSIDIKFHLDKPNINGEETVTLTWSSQLADKMVLEYIFENKIQKQEWTANLDQEKTYDLTPYQTSTYTLTTYKETNVQDQKQFVVQVIPNEFQFLKNLYYGGWDLSNALESCFKRYHLLPLTKESIVTLIDAAKRANYSEEGTLNFLKGYLELASPVITSFSYTGSVFRITWNTVQNADNYELELFNNSDQIINSTKVNSTINSLEITPVQSPEPGIYKIQVRTIAISVIFSSWSNQQICKIEPTISIKDFNWQVTGPGTTSINSSNNNSITFNYSLAGDIVHQEQTWKYSATSSKTGVVKFNWKYSGFHGWYQVKAEINAFSKGLSEEEQTQKLSFGVGGSMGGEGQLLIKVNQGYEFGFVITGSNFDSDTRLLGNLTITDHNN